MSSFLTFPPWLATSLLFHHLLSARKVFDNLLSQTTTTTNLSPVEISYLVREMHTHTPLLSARCAGMRDPSLRHHFSRHGCRLLTRWMVRAMTCGHPTSSFDSDQDEEYLATMVKSVPNTSMVQMSFNRCLTMQYHPQVSSPFMLSWTISGFPCPATVVCFPINKLTYFS